MGDSFCGKRGDWCGTTPPHLTVYYVYDKDNHDRPITEDHVKKIQSYVDAYNSEERWFILRTSARDTQRGTFNSESCIAQFRGLLLAIEGLKFKTTDGVDPLRAHITARLATRPHKLDDGGYGYNLKGPLIFTSAKRPIDVNLDLWKSIHELYPTDYCLINKVGEVDSFKITSGLQAKRKIRGIGEVRSKKVDACLKVCKEKEGRMDKCLLLSNDNLSTSGYANMLKLPPVPRDRSGEKRKKKDVVVSSGSKVQGALWGNISIVNEEERKNNNNESEEKGEEKLRHNNDNIQMKKRLKVKIIPEKSEKRNNSNIFVNDSVRVNVADKASEPSVKCIEKNKPKKKTSKTMHNL